MTRRYTGAEARELRRGVGPFEVSGVVIVNAHPAAAIRCVADINDQTLGPLLAAAPDLAESLDAVEAERDAGVECVRALRDMLSQTERERDALRAAVRSALAAYDAVYCDDGYHLDREAALAALREAAK